MTPFQKEVLFAIAKCREKKLLEEDALSTGTLTKELNSNQSRSRDWDPFEVGIRMAELGFAMSVTPTTHQRGWLVKGKQVTTG
ncbi:MAG TPA: hypothetical protein VF910_03550 [Candidatus Bathyarchaeia archaeon]